MITTQTVPPSVEQLSTADLDYAFDFTWACQQVSATETLSSASITATQEDTGTSAPQILQGSPSVSGTIVRQGITSLTAGKSFRVIVTATGASGNVWAIRTDFICPF